MADVSLVARLRGMTLPGGYNGAVLTHAADEIERLTRERDEARLEIAKLWGWVTSAEQGAGRLQRQCDDARAEAHDTTVLLIHRTRERDEARADVERLTADRLSKTGMDVSVLVGYEAGQQEIDRLRALLREVQWGEGWGCPICLTQATERAHAPDCRLAAALEGQDG